MISLIFLIVSFIVAYAAIPLMIPRLRRNGISGQDRNKPDHPEVAEMGGLGIILGFGAGIILVVFLASFTGLLSSVDLQSVLAVFSTVLIASIIGILDDLIDIKQWVKALAPLFSALPLMALKVGDSVMTIPFFGSVDFGILYSLLLVPIGVTVAANAVNMLGGFNGVEAGMGLIGTAALAIIAFRHGETTTLLILLSATGALLAFLRYNWYPAKVFIGDVGTLTIGAVIASAAIIGNFEAAGIIVMVPYILEFIIKARNGFPSQGWWGVNKNGKLYCPEPGFKGMGQLIMRLTNGISERGLALTLMGLEAVCGLTAVLIFK
jgi:UDP-N-acetylglucosamine--dolichyl-phosphate N-acetylglucosaminephosphotransferase